MLGVIILRVVGGVCTHRRRLNSGADATQLGIQSNGSGLRILSAFVVRLYRLSTVRNRSTLPKCRLHGIPGPSGLQSPDQSPLDITNHGAGGGLLIGAYLV